MLRIAQKIRNGEKPVLAFFGDSVTQGMFEFENDFKDCVIRSEHVYHKLLADRIQKELGQEIVVVNAGVGGDYSGDGLARIQRDVLDKKPDFCCVMFGTNDVADYRKGKKALETYEQNMRQIFTTLQKHGIETVMMTPAMLCSRNVKGFTRAWWWIVHKYYEFLQRTGKVDLYIESARKVAREMNIPIADAYAEWKKMEAAGIDTTALLCNGLNHPGPEQHKIFADKLYDLLFN